MAKKKPTKKVQPDLLVLGDHPCAHFAAILLREALPGNGLLHASLPDETWDDRLVHVNPAFFGLHASLAPLRRQLDLVPIHGLKFLSDDSSVRSAHSVKDVAGFVGSFIQIHDAMVTLAEKAKVEFARPVEISIHHLDEAGISISLDGRRIHPKLLILAGEPPAALKKLLGLPPAWETGVVHRYTFLKLKGAKWVEPSLKHLLAMSLDLRGELHWGWLHPGKGCAQIAVVQVISSIARTPHHALLKHWAQVLLKHGELKTLAGIDFDSATSLDLPLTGALAHETVANRTLLIGPAGGFFTACAEDIYPTCWSATFAADVARDALKARHVQDALQAYRHKWGATLGDFLRGPQQNLRFLMPLVYRNPMMTARLTEAILLGKSVVR